MYTNADLKISLFVLTHRGGSKAAATSKMEHFVIALHLGCCSSPRSASDSYKYNALKILRS